MTIAALRASGKGLLAIGLLCSALTILLVWLFEQAGMHYLASVGLAFPIVLVAGYLLHARFTFSERPAVRSFLPYAGAMAVNLPASTLLLVLLCESLGLGSAAGMAVVTLILATWNLLSPLLAFKLGRKARVKPSGPVV
jgi:putative flippase GtrA